MKTPTRVEAEFIARLTGKHLIADRSVSAGVYVVRSMTINLSYEDFDSK